MQGILNPEKVVNLGYIHQVRAEDIQPNSIDLRVLDIYEIKGNLVLFADKNNRRELPEYHLIQPFPYGDGFKMYKLEPGKRYQVEFEALLDLPQDVCAITLVRSTMAKSGCTGENGLFDSGYKGACGMMIAVQAESYIEEYAPIAQMVFFGAESSKLYNGFYQGTNSPLEWL